jgi:DNA-binding transcriptional LysR family regulator
MHQLSQRAIYAFLITFRTGSIASASEILNLTSPAISRLLRDLEEDIGFPLFRRVRGRLHRTPEGVAFHEEVSRSFIGLERLQTAANNIQRGYRFRLVVNALPSFASTCMPSIIAEFMAENPNTNLSVQPLPSDEIIRRVRSHECNFGVVEKRVFPSGINELHEYKDTVMCILPPGHPLCARSVIEPEDLDGEVFIQLIMASQTGEVVSRMLAERNVRCGSIIECRLSYLAQKLVMSGVGIAIIDPLTARLHAELGGPVRPFSIGLQNSISFIGQEDSVLTDTETRFVEKAISWLNGLSGLPYLQDGRLNVLAPAEM